ncbi:group II intron maturase-specific domain-containing protein [Cupriavidus sp. UME77]|uniref:group II intron maturase-specific domain-containing protein n=1 Tax=Cupriavidus sp. UME77 TaxID=1862321 RepID=UPI002105D630|nr:group II intron maturase-specific domain-containing protein [Cupriavidus sp. UME77]
MRRCIGARWPESPKPSTCTERCGVDPTGISVKVGASYPGRSAPRGRRLAHTIAVLNPVLRGWIGYFQHTEAKGVLETLDGWMRRRLRCLLWRQAKSRATRTVMLRRQGVTEDRAWHSARNGQGPWWNAGARGLPEGLLRHHGADLATGYPAALAVSFVNRRMRNRTYGGVRGLRG